MLKIAMRLKRFTELTKLKKTQSESLMGGVLSTPPSELTGGGGSEVPSVPPHLPPVTSEKGKKIINKASSDEKGEKKAPIASENLSLSTMREPSSSSSPPHHKESATATASSTNAKVNFKFAESTETSTPPPSSGFGNIIISTQIILVEISMFFLLI